MFLRADFLKPFHDFISFFFSIHLETKHFQNPGCVHDKPHLQSNIAQKTNNSFLRNRPFFYGSDPEF